MPEDTPDVNTADDQPASSDPAPDLAAKTVDELKTEASRRGVQVEGTGKSGNVRKADLVEALEPVMRGADLPPDPRQQEDTHPLTQAAEQAAADARIRDRSAMFTTDTDQE